MKLKKLNNKINYKDFIVKAKIFNVKGSSPNKIDDIILISNDTIFGTIGGGNLEHLVVKEAKILINNKIDKKSLNIIPIVLQIPGRPVKNCINKSQPVAKPNLEFTSLDDH